MIAVRFYYRGITNAARGVWAQGIVGLGCNRARSLEGGVRPKQSKDQSNDNDNITAQLLLLLWEEHGRRTRG
jgi:hypothetical protein